MKKLNEDDLKKIILEVKNEKIHGINVTLPFKKKVIPFFFLYVPFTIKASSFFL